MARTLISISFTKIPANILSQWLTLENLSSNLCSNLLIYVFVLSWAQLVFHDVATHITATLLGLFFLVVCAIRTRRTPTSDAADPKAQAVVTHGQHESPEVPSPGGAGVNSVTPPGGDPSSSKGVSSVERTSSSKSGFRTSRRALFRHKKLEDVYSEDEDDVFESRTEPRDGKAREVSKETSPVHQLKNSARKGDSSVQYNRMRSQSDVDISITNHSFDI